MCETTKLIFPRCRGFYYQILKHCHYIVISPTSSFIESLTVSTVSGFSGIIYLINRPGQCSYSSLRVTGHVSCVSHVSVLLMRNTPGLCHLLDGELFSATLDSGTWHTKCNKIWAHNWRTIETTPVPVKFAVRDLASATANPGQRHPAVGQLHQTNATRASYHPHLPSTIQISQHPKCRFWKSSPMKNIAPCHKKKTHKKLSKE